jgi:ATP-dependent helicase/nuclease subunit B
LKKLKEELKFIIITIKKQYEHISLDKTLYEEKIYVSKNTNITFMGIIDKLMYKEEDDITYCAIIDYKTGNPNLNLNNMIYGIDMQLPIYLYLSKRTNKLKNVEVLGFYLQKILNNEITIDNKLTYEKQKENNLKLQGYSIDDMNKLEKFDDSYIDSEIIKSMKVSKNGFYSYAKVLDKKTLDLIDNLVDKKIDEAINSIMNAKFDINPKKIGDKNVSCTFCKYKDICYKTENDLINLKEYKELDFLQIEN